THPGRRPAPRARGGGQRHARGRRPVCRACRPGTRQPGLPGREWRIMAARHRLEERTGRRHGLLTTFAVVVGVVFLVVGILGFVPGVTTNLGELEWYGHESRAELFGIFQVSVLHNAVHLLFGVLGLLMAWTAVPAMVYLVGGGVVYLALWIYGMVIERESAANFIPLNTADDWLHLFLGAGMIILGLIGWAARSQRA